MSDGRLVTVLASALVAADRRQAAAVVLGSVVGPGAASHCGPTVDRGTAVG